MTKSANRVVGYDNANSGAIFSNGADMLGVLLGGTWEDARNAKFGLGLGADVDGVRVIGSINAQGGTVSKGTVRVNSGKGPAYRGNLGHLKIVLWNMGSYYQVRLDAGVPQRAVSVETAAFFGTEPVDPDVAPPAKVAKAAVEPEAHEGMSAAAAKRAPHVPARSEHDGSIGLIDAIDSAVTAPAAGYDADEF